MLTMDNQCHPKSDSSFQAISSTPETQSAAERPVYGSTATANTEITPLNSSIPAKRRNDSDEVAPAHNGTYDEPSLYVSEKLIVFTLLRDFKSVIFDIYVGAEKCKFSIHDSFLMRCPKLKSMCMAQGLRKGQTKAGTTLFLPREDSNTFGYLLEYLYFGALFTDDLDPMEEARLLADLFSLGSRCQSDSLVKDIVIRLETSKMSSRISPSQFLHLTEDLFTENNDTNLREYFVRAVPELFKTIEEPDFPEIDRMIGDGGTFAIALFAAYREAFGPKAKILNDWADAKKGSDIQVDVELEPNDEPEHKKSRTSFHEPRNISCSWCDLKEIEKSLIRLRAKGDPWDKISEALEMETGEKIPIKELITRYASIFTDWRRVKIINVCSPPCLLAPVMFNGVND